MAKYDQLGKIVPLVFYSDEFYIFGVDDESEEKLTTQGYVFEEAADQPLEVIIDRPGEIGHAALYASYLYHKEKQAVILERSGIQTTLDEDTDFSEITAAYMSPREVRARFKHIAIGEESDEAHDDEKEDYDPEAEFESTEVLLTEEETQEIAYTALLLSAAYIKELRKARKKTRQKKPRRK